MAVIRRGVWQMGVAAPLKNVKMRYGEEIAGTLTVAVLVGDATISVDTKTIVPGWHQVFRANDFLKIGPSSHIDNPGMVEWLKIDSGGIVDLFCFLISQ